MRESQGKGLKRSKSTFRSSKRSKSSFRRYPFTTIRAQYRSSIPVLYFSLTQQELIRLLPRDTSLSLTTSQHSVYHQFCELVGKREVALRVERLGRLSIESSAESMYHVSSSNTPPSTVEPFLKKDWPLAGHSQNLVPTILIED